MKSLGRKLFKAVVWSETATATPGAGFDVVMARLKEPPPWGNHPTHFVLMPSNAQVALPSLPDGVEVLQLGPSTSLGDLNSEDFDRYCSKTVESTVASLKLIGTTCEGPLGVVADRKETNKEKANDVFKEAGATSAGGWIRWATYAVDDKKAYYGPDLIQLVEKLMVSRGIDPRRAIAVAVLRNLGWTEEGIDHLLAYHACFPRDPREDTFPQCVVHIGDGSVPSDLQTSAAKTFAVRAVEPMLVSARDVEDSLQYVNFAQPIALHPRASLLLDRNELRIRLARHRELESKNLENGRKLVHEFTKQRTPWNGRECPPDDPEFQNLFEDGEVFDHRSGAVCFSAYTWSKECLKLEEPWRGVVTYFEEVLEVPWRRDRPCFRRILTTPSKIILRGDDYYANLRNIHPLKRIDTLLNQMNPALEVCDALGNAGQTYDSIEKWKLALGLVDQVRNVALQLAWFENQLATNRAFTAFHVSGLADTVGQFLDATTCAYYSILQGGSSDDPGNLEMLTTLRELWDPLNATVQVTLEDLRKAISKWKTDPTNLHLMVTKLIRGWREADHPGENTIVALDAIRRLPDRTYTAVGIGWGGIELPIVYRQVAELLGKKAPRAIAVHYSKYSEQGQKGTPVMRGVLPPEDEPNLDKEEVVVFDDNSLSGNTIEIVAEYLLLKHGARTKGVFVTRLSGERRYDQMRMDDHGVLNPDLVGTFVHGHLGETPFSRAWSRKSYKNPVGVFSLARRRILELLHSNISADRYDREGF